jgi:hypothetical protein
MLQGYSPVIQALLGTLMTWGLTALGASVAILVQGNQVCPDDSRLAFSESNRSDFCISRPKHLLLNSPLAEQRSDLFHESEQSSRNRKSARLQFFRHVGCKT